MKRTALVLVPVLLLAACASDDDGRRGSSGPRWTSSSRVDAPGGAPTIRTFPPETRAFMQEGLRQFSKSDARWESTRREWLAMGPRESEFLVQSMWAALLAAQERNAPDLVERARHELALIGTPSVPLMASVLRTGTMTSVEDRESGTTREIAVDDQQRQEAAEILSIIGAPAVDATVEALEGADTKAGRRHALNALGNMGERGGPKAAQTLIRWSRDSDDVLRVAAVHGMRNMKDAATMSALVGALGDTEKLVREKAGDALVVRGDRSAVPAIRSAALRAQSEARLDEFRRLSRAAELLEKRGR